MRESLLLAAKVASSVAACLLAACGEAPSAKGLVAGEVRLSRAQEQGDDARAPKAYAGSAAFACRLEYAGPRKRVEWRTEVWTGGKLATAGKWSVEVWRPPGADVRFELTESKGATTTFFVDGEFEFSDALGGSTTVGGKRHELHPGAKHIVTLARAPINPVIVPDTEDLVLWGVLGGQEPLNLPADATPESAAEAAGWAMLLRLRFTP